MIPLTLYFIGWWDQMQKSLHFEIWSEVQRFQHSWKLAKRFWIIKLWLLWEAHWSQQWAWEISSQEQQEASSSQACHSISSKENWSLCKSTVSFLLLVLQCHILVHIFMINILFIFFMCKIYTISLPLPSHEGHCVKLFAFAKQYVAFWCHAIVLKIWHLKFEWKHDTAMSVLLPTLYINVQHTSCLRNIWKIMHTTL